MKRSEINKIIKEMEELIDLTFPVVTPPHDEPSGSDLRGIEGGLATLTSSKVVTL